MQIKSLGVNSHGNCHLLTSASGSTIMLDCGVRYQNILRNVSDFSNIEFVLYTHEHNDHVRSLADLRKAGLKCYGYDNLKDGQKYRVGEWRFMPMKMVHSVDCVGFYIYNNTESKAIAYITDTCVLPTMKDRPIDVLIVECNYTESLILAKAEELKFSNSNYNDHTSTEELHAWLDVRKCKPKNLIVTHMSNTNLDYIYTQVVLQKHTDNLFFAQKGETICLN